MNLKPFLVDYKQPTMRSKKVTLLPKYQRMLEQVGENRKVKKLYDIDFLLGIYDAGRMGALRFKLDPEGDFQNSDNSNPIPSWSYIRELQKSVQIVESDATGATVEQHLALLIAPGTSLGERTLNPMFWMTMANLGLLSSHRKVI